jgi:SAM-dependent methyltransferase
MSSQISDLQECPLCQSRDRIELYRTRDRHYRIAGEWSVCRCTGCDLIQLSPMLTTEQLMRLYPTTFYAYQDLAKKSDGLAGRLKKWIFPSLYVRDPTFRAPGTVLDSGCGTGWALLPFRSRGWRCVGVEPSVEAAKFGREQYGLDIFGGTVHDAAFQSASFDYIRSNHSLEHDPAPGRTLAEFRRIIRDSGKLLIGVPNYSGLAAKVFRKYWWYLGAPVHTFTFTRRHLERLLERNGFVVEHVRYTGNYGGVIGSIQIFLNRNRPCRTSTEGWLISSNPARVIGQALSCALNAMRLGDAIEIVARPADTSSAAGSR